MTLASSDENIAKQEGGFYSECLSRILLNIL